MIVSFYWVIDHSEKFPLSILSISIELGFFKIDLKCSLDSLEIIWKLTS